MNFYYTENECNKAIATITEEITKEHAENPEYKWGANDCACLLTRYDKALRGADNSNAEITFKYNNTREFLVKLKREGFTVEEYLEFCGYEIIKNKRPIVGDVAFNEGAMIATNKGWIGITEKHSGIIRAKQMMYLELNINIIARPIRS